MNSVVYFIEGSLGIKIGYSGDLRTRIYSLKMKYGNDITVLGVIEGDRKVEASLHKRFAEHLVYEKEWFAKHQEIYSFIQSHATPDYMSYLYKKYVRVNIPFPTYKLLALLSEAIDDSIPEIITDLLFKQYPGIDVLAEEYWKKVRAIDPGKGNTNSISKGD
jgi:hypothetical protein